MPCTGATWKPSLRTSSSDSGAINGVVSPGFVVAGCESSSRWEVTDGVDAQG